MTTMWIDSFTRSVHARESGSSEVWIMTHLFWSIAIVGVVLVGEAAWAELREHLARRDAARRGRTFTARYGLPWR
jgi:hypothetical protein